MSQRELKFRAWNGLKMVDLYKITPLALSVEQDGVFIPFGHEYAIMQFTGLQDKNGKDIYEGDIVKSDYNRGFGPIVFEERTVELSSGDDFTMIGFWWVDDDDGFATDIFGKTSKYEVIGNVHENPELLDGEVLAGGPGHHIPGVS